MIQTALGLVLRIRPLTETSLIVHWLTRDHGRLASVAKGARRPKSVFRGKLDLFYLAEFSFRRSQRSDLHNLAEVSLLEPHAGLRRDVGFLQQAAYCAELIERNTEIESPVPAIFGMMRQLLAVLPAQPPQPKTLLAFELKFLAELGLQPDLGHTGLSAGSLQIARRLIEDDWEGLGRLQPTAAQVTELSNFLRGFMMFHLNRIPVGRARALGMTG